MESPEYCLNWEHAAALDPSFPAFAVVPDDSPGFAVAPAAIAFDIVVARLETED